jgi:beta-lactamase superfamily II metal-dependent hydrolase
MTIYVLDVGPKKYGDCILITHEGKSILIDGAHPGDQNLLRTQLSKILQQQPPFNIDLLVVTHCHLDHIGCLPTLIQDGSLRPKRALVADEKLGFGRTDDGIGPTDAPGLTNTQKLMIVALQEEDHSDLPDDEVRQFLDDAITLEERYTTMLATMKENGCDIVRYTEPGTQKIKSLETTFKKFGLKILGPSEEHLITCAQTIGGIADSINEDTFDILTDDTTENDMVRLYRQIMRGIKEDTAIDDAESQASAAKNNQSIVIKVSASGWSGLLAGDMQYASPGVDDMEELMDTALQEAVDAGPYDFIKITHHTASNGLNQKIFDAFAPCPNYVHTGGKNDPTHPNKNALQVLKKNASKIKFLRTDRHGMITIKKGTKVTMTGSKGSAEDFSLNTASDTERIVIPGNETVTVVQQHTGNDFIELTAKIPVSAGRVTITVDVDGEKKNSESLIAASFAQADKCLGAGRNLPPLLFVTCSELLSKNIGTGEAQTALDIIRACPTATLLDIRSTTHAPTAAKSIHTKLKTGNFEGVVIVGGYDVVPSHILDVLDPSLRANIVSLKGKKDQDNFVVWSDDIYVDLDGDSLPELPVSRIPDARWARLLLSSLTAPSFTQGRTFGVRNIERPFADEVYKLLSTGGGSMFVSETFAPSQVEKDTALGAVYYMLHGHDRDGTIYWGESLETDEDNELFDAVSIDNVPANAQGTIVFAGCCWGALTVFPKASLASKHILSPKSPEDSIALTYLLNGAQAFVGCTGTHYSPGQKPYNYYGRPMHDLFWRNIAQSKPPALALWEAKKAYSRAMPHGQSDVYSWGIEHKILREFTCLGLGW